MDELKICLLCVSFLIPTTKMPGRMRYYTTGMDVYRKDIQEVFIDKRSKSIFMVLNFVTYTLNDVIRYNLNDIFLMCNTCNYWKINSVNSVNPWNTCKPIFIDNSHNPHVRNPHNSCNSVCNPGFKKKTLG